MSAMNESLRTWFEEHEERVRALMHDIWSHPELALHEYYACEAMVRFLREQGFSDIQTYAAEDFQNPEARPNTVIATYGSGRPVIAIVGELDALPDLGQEPVPHYAPVAGPGHGCGHNLMGGGAAAAAAALRYAMEREAIPGTLKVILAPAEETGVGKGYLAKNGVFSDLDMALMWHPAPGKLDLSPVRQRVAFRVSFAFHGKTAHAAGAPWNGRSALDAVQLMNLGSEFLREHIRPGGQLHYAITNGGSAPNVVPEYAAVQYMFRSVDDYALAEDIFQRVVQIAKGAAMMTDTQMTYHVESVIPQFYYNLPLCRLMARAAEKVPPLRYSPEEMEQARALYRSLFQEEPPQDDEELLPTGYLPFNTDKAGTPNCTDAADMTYFCPTLHCQGLGRVKGGVGHHWNVTYTSGCSLGEKAGIYAYEVIAQGAYEAFRDPKIVETCWEAYRAMQIPPHKDWL